MSASNEFNLPIMTKASLLNIIKRFYTPIVLFIFAILFVAYFLNNHDDFLTLKDVTLIDVLIVVAIQISILIVNAIMLLSLCRLSNVNLPFLETMAITIKSSAINFFAFMQGGIGYRAIYLKKRHNLSIKQFLVLYGANTLIIFAVSSFVALAGIGIRLWQGRPVDIVAIILFSSIAIFMVILFLFSKSINLQSNNRLITKLNQALSGWRLLANNYPTLAVIFSLALAQSLLMSLLFYVQLRAVDFSPSLSGTLIYSGLANISILFSFTPGSIGLREALLIFAQNSLGVDTSAIILSSALDRLVYFLLLILLGIIATFLKPRSAS